jgi:hypothetical protein
MARRFSTLHIQTFCILTWSLIWNSSVMNKSCGSMTVVHILQRPLSKINFYCIIWLIKLIHKRYFMNKMTQISAKHQILVPSILVICEDYSLTFSSVSTSPWIVLFAMNWTWVCLTEHHAMETHWRVEVYIHTSHSFHQILHPHNHPGQVQ